MTRYYAETPCEHGQMNSHNAIRLPSGEVVDDEVCPGGQRRELTGVQVVEAVSQWDGVGYQCNVPVSGSGRYAIIPLEDPE